MSSAAISKPIQHHLDSFNDFFREQMKSNVALLDTVVRYILKSRGKQVRPSLVFLCAELCGGVSKRSFFGAAMVELLHTATLVHDDVVDGSQERRGMASINAVWKNKVAVLVGDYLLSRGLLIAAENDEFEFLKITSRAVRRMSEGELLQIQKAMQTDIDEATYYKIIADKTASLLSTCCEIGAVSATANKEHHEALKEYGERVGMAFQIRDDVLDYESKTVILGKPIGNDIKEGKLTLPLIYACSRATKKEASAIIKKVKSGKVDQKIVDEVQQFVRSQGGIDYANTKANEMVEHALACLHHFPESTIKTTLVEFARYVVERNK